MRRQSTPHQPLGERPNERVDQAGKSEPGRALDDVIVIGDVIAIAGKQTEEVIPAFRDTGVAAAAE